MFAKGGPYHKLYGDMYRIHQKHKDASTAEEFVALGNELQEAQNELGRDPIDEFARDMAVLIFEDVMRRNARQDSA